MSPVLLDYDTDDQMITQYIIGGEHEECTKNIYQKKGEKCHLGDLTIDWNILKE
jgi:hypothetical protein